MSSKQRQDGHTHEISNKSLRGKQFFFYSGNETWKKYISNHYNNNFICVSITFTNIIYLTYKKGNYYAYKIYVDDYPTRRNPGSSS